MQGGRTMVERGKEGCRAVETMVERGKDDWLWKQW